MKALLAAHEEREAVEAWDPVVGEPEANGSNSQERWRLQAMAGDRQGYLRRARTDSERAASLARTSAEVYRAAEHLAKIEHEAGRHESELGHAWTLMTLDPNNVLSLITLRRAQACLGIAPSAQSSSRL